MNPELSEKQDSPLNSSAYVSFNWLGFKDSMGQVVDNAIAQCPIDYRRKLLGFKLTRYPPGSLPKRREVRTPPKTNTKNGKTTFTMEKQPLKIDVLVFPVPFKMGCNFPGSHVR